MKLLIKYVKLNLKRLSQQPTYLALFLLAPLAVYIAGLLCVTVFFPIELIDAAQYYLITSIVFSILLNSYLYLARNMSNDKKQHFDIVLKNNKKYFIFNLSYIVVYGLLVLASSILLFILSFIYGGLIWSALRYIALLLFAFIGALVFACFGICASLIPRKFFSLVGYIVLFIAFLSGVFIPLSAFTGGTAPVLEIIPIYNLSNIGWQFIYSRIYSEIDFVFLGLWSLGFLSIASIFYPQPPEYTVDKKSVSDKNMSDKNKTDRN